MYLSHADIEAHIPEYVGAVRVVHAGNCYDESLSKSRALKIERKPDGTINAFCFRCGSRYFGRDRSYVPRAPSSVPRGYSARPGSATYNLAQWPGLARTWLRKARLTQQHCDRYNIGYVAGVGVTVPEPGGSGYLVRPFNNGGGSKYVVRGGMSDFIADMSEFQGPIGTAVIVEDCLSAIRVADCGASGVALLGTYLKDETKEKLVATGYQRLVLWLDDDSPTVRVIQARLGAVLRQFAPTYVVRGEREPKHLPNREILTILSNSDTIHAGYTAPQGAARASRDATIERIMRWET